MTQTTSPGILPSPLSSLSMQRMRQSVQTVDKTATYLSGLTNVCMQESMSKLAVSNVLNKVNVTQHAANALMSYQQDDIGGASVSAMKLYSLVRTGSIGRHACHFGDTKDVWEGSGNQNWTQVGLAGLSLAVNLATRGSAVAAAAVKVTQYALNTIIQNPAGFNTYNQRTQQAIRHGFNEQMGPA